MLILKVKVITAGNAKDFEHNLNKELEKLAKEGVGQADISYTHSVIQGYMEFYTAYIKYK